MIIPARRWLVHREDSLAVSSEQMHRLAFLVCSYYGGPVLRNYDLSYSYPSIFYNGRPHVNYNVGYNPI